MLFKIPSFWIHFYVIQRSESKCVEVFKSADGSRHAFAQDSQRFQADRRLFDFRSCSPYQGGGETDEGLMAVALW